MAVDTPDSTEEKAAEREDGEQWTHPFTGRVYKWSVLLDEWQWTGETVPAFFS